MSDTRYNPDPSSPHDPVPNSPELGQVAFPAYTQPLAGEDVGDITGLGGFPNAHFSRYSQASSLSPSLPSARNMTRSDSTYTDVGSDGGYLPVTGGSAARPASSLSSAAMLPNSGASDRGSYMAAPLGSPQLDKEGGFEVAQAEKYAAGSGGEQGTEYGAPVAARGSLWQRKKKLILVGGALMLVIIVVAVAVPVSLSNNSSGNNNAAVVVNPNAAAASAQSSTKGTKTTNASPSASSSPTVAPAVAKFGVNGSTVMNPDGSESFTYENEFGGYWGFDASSPFDINSAGRCQDWSPRLNETFEYGKDKIRGVNFGGWLNTEPFIVPGLYEKYANSTPRPVDEWTLSLAMGDNLAAEMEEHYKTFITEKDFMEVAAAGLNYVRIPIGYWALEVEEGEPFLAKVSWTYFLKAIEWARKYGIRINLDLHAVPGSQNAWNHSGKMGAIGFVHGQMGLVNAQRTLNYVRTLAQFISQPEYRDVVTMFGILNEPFIPTIGAAPVEAWYTEAYNLVREITGLGADKGPWIALHDGFNGVSSWKGFLEGADRVSLDTHTYIAFDTPQHDLPLSAFPKLACEAWGNQINNSMEDFGLTHSGEWSMAVNDCGQWVTGVGLGTRWTGTFDGQTTVFGSCDSYNDWRSWDAARMEGFKNFALAQMDALQNYFFWTWHIGDSPESGFQPNPMWNYKLGLEKGWSPKDPRDATGVCASLDVTATNQFDGTFPAWHTGGAGAGESVSTRNAWPPASFADVPAAQMTRLPQLVMSAPAITLPAPTYTSPAGTATIPAGNGWVNPSDTASAYAKVSGCAYPDAWTDGSKSAYRSTSACGAGAIETKLLKRAPEPTSAPAAPTYHPHARR